MNDRSRVKGFVNDEGIIESIEGDTEILPGDMIFLSVGVSAEVIQHVPRHPNTVVRITP